jgi:glutamyl/glutaminyl-tRNA synthetase
MLRLEDVDPLRCTPESADEMRAALRWLGLEWDAELVQSARRTEHEASLEQLAESGLLYPCSCSRAEIRRAGTAAADGGTRYPGTCRERELPAGGWRSCDEALRLRLPSGRIALRDESGLDLSQDPLVAMGDPIVRRRDGAIAYHLAVVVDDARDGITRVVRGRDLAASTAIHRVLQQALGLTPPTYRHHFLLLEEHGGKLAKLHGAVGWRELSEKLSAEQTCGVLARAAGLRETSEPTGPGALLRDFAWERVETRDQALRWTGSALEPLRPIVPKS